MLLLACTLDLRHRLQYLLFVAGCIVAEVSAAELNLAAGDYALVV